MNGKNVTWLKPADRNMAFVFQFYALYPHLSVRENILFPLRAARLPRAEREATLKRVAQRLGLDALLDLGRVGIGELFRLQRQALGW